MRSAHTSETWYEDQSHRGFDGPFANGPSASSICALPQRYLASFLVGAFAWTAPIGQFDRHLTRLFPIFFLRGRSRTPR